MTVTEGLRQIRQGKEMRYLGTFKLEPEKKPEYQFLASVVKNCAEFKV